MNKTELFTRGIGEPYLKPIRDYRKFVEDTPNITIISVINLEHDYILLTYKEG